MDKKCESVEALADIMLTQLSKDPQLAAKQRRWLDLLKGGHLAPTPDGAAADPTQPANQDLGGQQ